jgi:hypothetical protein
VAAITYQLVRDGYRLELSLDDDTRCFTLICQPPNLLEQPDVQKKVRSWCQRVARGFSERHHLAYLADVKLLPVRKAGTLHGRIVTQ